MKKLLLVVSLVIISLATFAGRGVVTNTGDETQGKVVTVTNEQGLTVKVVVPASVSVQVGDVVIYREIGGGQRGVFVEKAN